MRLQLYTTSLLPSPVAIICKHLEVNDILRCVHLLDFIQPYFQSKETEIYKSRSVALFYSRKYEIFCHLVYTL